MADHEHDAAIIDHAGPFCHAEAHADGVRVYFQRVIVDIAGKYTVHNRGGGALYSGNLEYNFSGSGVDSESKSC